VCPDEPILRWRDEGASAEDDDVEDVVELRDLTDEQDDFERYTPYNGDLQGSNGIQCIAFVEK
jgi:hypothetical protein